VPVSRCRPPGAARRWRRGHFVCSTKSLDVYHSAHRPYAFTQCTLTFCMQHQVTWCASLAPTDSMVLDSCHSVSSSVSVGAAHLVQLDDGVEGVVGHARHEGLAVRADRLVQLRHTQDKTRPLISRAHTGCQRRAQRCQDRSGCSQHRLVPCVAPSQSECKQANALSHLSTPTKIRHARGGRKAITCQGKAGGHYTEAVRPKSPSRARVSYLPSRILSLGHQRRPQRSGRAMQREA
jgi:hypothetical protein